MEENGESKVSRIPIELEDWIKDIQIEFEKKRGFIPCKSDVLKNIVRQFKGQFIV